MAIESVSRMGAAAYQSSGANQVRAVEATVQPAQIEQAVEQVATTVQTTQQSGNNTEGRNGQQDVNRDNEKVKKAVGELNKQMTNTFCQFGVHEGTGRITIKVLDKETKDVLKEFPAEETLEMIEKVWEIAGLMVDKKL